VVYLFMFKPRLMNNKLKSRSMDPVILSPAVFRDPRLNANPAIILNADPDICFAIRLKVKSKNFTFFLLIKVIFSKFQNTQNKGTIQKYGTL
jgi:hypothetical protein